MELFLKVYVVFSAIGLISMLYCIANAKELPWHD